MESYNRNIPNTENYANEYSDESLMSKAKRFGKKMGGKLLYNVFVLYYVLKSPDVPIKIKGVIVGALGYVIVPVDLIPDFIPVGGYVDDLGAITTAVETARAYITPDIQRRATDKVRSILGSIEGCDLAA